MKPTILLLTAILAVGRLHAQPAEDWSAGTVELGLSQRDVNTLSSKFLEYRDVPNGLVSPSIRIQGEKSGLRYDFLGQNARQTDEAYQARLRNDHFKLQLDYNRIPHNFGFDGHTLLQQTSEGVWQMSDTLQKGFQGAITSVPAAGVTFPFLRDLVAPSLATANSVDLSLDRQRGNVSFTLTPRKDLDVKVAYFRERRTGNRAASGTSFGFGNVVELPEALHYLTQDFGTDVEYRGSWGVARVGFHHNWFRDGVSSFSFDNPFRGTDSTDASAYTGPASGSVGGATFGTMALPPDNQASTGTAGLTFKLPRRTRINADVAIGQWTQNSTAFLPYTTNTAITPSAPAAARPPFDASAAANLPASHLDGQIDTRSFSLAVSSRPADHLSLVARYRYWDLDNQTPRVSFPGYVRFDAVWEAIPRISVPYGHKNQRLDATLAYDFGPLTLEGGYRHNTLDRTFRETERTTENAVSVAANLRTRDWLVLRAGYEHARRSYHDLEIERSEDGSQLAPGLPVSLLAVPATSDVASLQAAYASLGCGSAPCNIRFDQAKRQSDRLSATATLAPGSGKVTLVLGYLFTRDDYDETRYGLSSARYDTLSADLDYTPSPRLTLYGFYTHEKNRDAQRGRQSGATVSANALDDWTSDVRDKGNSFGTGSTITLVPQKWTLDLLGSYQKVNGFNSIFSSPGGAPFLGRVNLFPANPTVAQVTAVESIAAYDDTELYSLGGELRYQLARHWTAALGGRYERYAIDDSNSSELPNYVPGSFFLAANDGSYRAHVLYVRATCAW